MVTERPDWFGPAMDMIRERMDDDRAGWIERRLETLDRAGELLERRIRERHEPIEPWQLQLLAEIRGETATDVVNRLLMSGGPLRFTGSIDGLGSVPDLIRGDGWTSEMYITHKVSLPGDVLLGGGPTIDARWPGSDAVPDPGGDPDQGWA
jgi:hypothetical protein